VLAEVIVWDLIVMLHFYKQIINWTKKRGNSNGWMDEEPVGDALLTNSTRQPWSSAAEKG